MGYYVASYAGPDAPAAGAYVGYAKVCTARPPSYWEAPACVIKVAAAGGFRSPPQAIEAAVEQARRHILHWATSIELDARQA